jgi:hypothetical protein
MEMIDARCTSVLNVMMEIVKLARSSATFLDNTSLSADDCVDPITGKLCDDRIEDVVAFNVEHKHCVAALLHLISQLLQELCVVWIPRPPNTTAMRRERSPA